MKPIIGVFENDRNLTRAVDELSSIGFNQDELHILDNSDAPPLDPRTKAADMTDTALASETMSTVADHAALNVFTPLISHDTAPELAESEVSRVLSEMEVPQEEIDFFLHEVNRGGKLLVVESDPNHVSDVRAVLERARATRVM